MGGDVHPRVLALAAAAVVKAAPSLSCGVDVIITTAEQIEAFLRTIATHHLLGLETRMDAAGHPGRIASLRSAAPSSDDAPHRLLQHEAFDSALPTVFVHDACLHLQTLQGAHVFDVQAAHGLLVNLQRHRGRTREQGRSGASPADVDSRGILSLGTLLGDYLLVRRGAIDGD